MMMTTQKYIHSFVSQFQFFFAFVTMAHVQATVSIDGITYDSVPYDFGKPLANDQLVANLFVAPNDNLCIDNFSEAPNNRALSSESKHEISKTNMRVPIVNVINSEQNSETLISNPIERRRISESYPIALIAFEGGCTFEEKARNAMTLNTRYSKDNGPQIQHLIFATKLSVNDLNHHGADFEVNETDLHIVFIKSFSGTEIVEKMQSFTGKRENRDYYLTENAFNSPSQIDANDWLFLVTIDGKRVTRNTPFSNLRFTMGYLFLVAFPLVTYMLARRYITRIAENQRSQLPSNFTDTPNNTDFFSRIVILLTDDESKESGLLTEEQIEALPIIEYGVSDIEAICHYGKENEQTKRITKVIPFTDNVDVVMNNKTDSENWATPKYLQDAYSIHTSCSICINEFKYKEKLVLLPQCGHFFRSGCIKPWLKERKGSCPLCQTFVSPDSIRKVGDI